MQDSGPWSRADAAAHLRAADDRDDKYTRGVVGMRTGSPAYPGAAVLGVEAAWRAGAGMVRYVGEPEVGRAVLARRPETVLAAGRVQAWVIGSGTDPTHRSAPEERALRDLLEGEAPVVVDAGALDLAAGATAPVLVTPHAGEFARLRRMLGLDPDAGAGADAVRQTASLLGAAVLRKGAETIVATPGGWCARIRSGTPWLSTAGTGDVLAGVLGAIIAAASEREGFDVETLGPLAATGAWVHGAAGRRAAGDPDGHGPGHPLVALEVAEEVPQVIGDLLGGGAGPRA
jgi:hydroxyethylthiazole kinase-like uncharacterized protein yjeF